MSGKVLSIIIPTYNMENYISKCLDSLLIPSIDLIEVLVINDGSKDKSSEIAHKYADQYPNSIRVIDKENGNYGSCINTGLKEVTGKYIKILDADDCFQINNFEAFVNFLKFQNSDLIISDYIKINENNKLLERKVFSLNPNEQLSISHILYENFPSMHAITYKMQLFSNFEYHQTEGLSYTDCEWVFKPMSRVKTISYFNKVVYHYLIGRAGQTISTKNYTKNISNLIAVSKSNLLFFHENREKIDKENKVYLKNWLISFLDSIYAKMLIHFYPSIRKKTIKEFDDLVHSTEIEIYNRLNNSRSSFNFKYIRFWRNNHSIPLLFICFNKTKNRVIRIKKFFYD